jgi:hypothetical protein
MLPPSILHEKQINHGDTESTEEDPPFHIPKQ